MAAAETRVPDATKALAEREASMDGAALAPDRKAQSSRPRRAGQGDRVSRSGGAVEQAVEVGDVPAGELPSVLEAGRGLGLPDQVHRHVPDHGHVLGTVAGP